jgi:hypothetical protein
VKVQKDSRRIPDVIFGMYHWMNRDFKRPAAHLAGGYKTKYV